MEIKPSLNNEIISKEDLKLVEKISKEYGLNAETFFLMVQEEIAHQGMARRVGLISKLHNLIKEDTNDNWRYLN